MEEKLIQIGEQLGYILTRFSVHYVTYALLKGGGCVLINGLLARECAQTDRIENIFTYGIVLKLSKT